MSKQREINKDLALKLMAELDQVAPKFQQEIHQELESRGCKIYARIKPIGPAEICIETKEDMPDAEAEIKLKPVWLRIRALEDKYQVELYAVIGPFGAEIKLRWSDKKEMNRVWVPPQSALVSLTK
jgi:hypothetical protein